MAQGEEIDYAMTHGIVFKKKKEASPNEKNKVKTKAKKKAYITGAHGSDSAKFKADIRRRRANRHKK
ncbi:MAG: hypothetical protein ACTTKN_05665 [Phocaeicola sp.]|uniref:hypothetical protein n=1 Tax=Phocaeicola sp. TaxID=2773926 RepID=UPI003FA1661F